MGIIHECASSVLLCREDNNSILCFDDDDKEEEENRHGWIPKERSDLYGVFFLMGFPQQSDESLGSMVERETDHMPREDYGKRLITGDLDMATRRDAIDWIWKVHAHHSFGPLSAYLSVNYLDRFLSAYQLPQDKAWMTQLLSVACLSLAAKMEESEVPPCFDLQVGESKYVFESRTIQRMELLVLSTLNWRMQAVTPFDFIDYFLHRLNDDNPPTKSSVAQAAEIVLNSVIGLDFVTFRPSEIAAAVAMSVVLGENRMEEFETAISSCNHVNKERVLRCYEVIQEVLLMKKRSPENASTSVSSVPDSPNGVLDVACLSYKSDDPSVDSPARKRRRISRQSVL